MNAVENFRFRLQVNGLAVMQVKSLLMVIAEDESITASVFPYVFQKFESVLSRCASLSLYDHAYSVSG